MSAPPSPPLVDRCRPARTTRPTPPRTRQRHRWLAWLLCTTALGRAWAEAAPPAVPPSAPDREGAIGLAIGVGPEYPGARERAPSVSPVLFFRVGRISLSSGGGFVTRGADTVAGGLGLEMVRRDALRLSLSLRYDRGRQADSGAHLKGMGDVPATLRARVAAHWRMGGGWRSSAAFTVDALGRGGGVVGDTSLTHEQALGRHTTLSLSAGLTAASQRWLQSYYGVTEAQAAASGYRVYRPDAGARDIVLSASLRAEPGQDLVMLLGVNRTRLLGPARDSPLVQQADGWGASVALAHRF